MAALKRWVLAAGLSLGLIWSVVVSSSMPSWWDPSKSCFDKLGPSVGPDATVHTSWFPPSATCDFGGGDVRDYLSTTNSVLLSITGILVLTLTAVGIVLTLRTLKGDPGPTRSADGADLTRRHRNHLLYGALDVLVVVAILSAVNVAAIVFGEIIGGVLFAITTVAGLAALATVLDRHTGPLPSTALASRRRGAAAGGILFGVIFGATALTGQLPFFRLWAAPLAAITYAVVVHVQWTKAATHQSHPASAQ
ncbi:hypothetical protein GCM10029976_079060 [Kribbella albertanoniae]|uniref:Uncharacterized protein n=1 Tax=Kribbella albertanoniae TaxID=1266829 RepID=A0A4R4QAU2_9ACTN|nr:hypothetical protein [Kribbella albertanoniae]TDC32182.1 hypothetical protein E1261_09085 [Kribbella albertanoniae]